MSDFCAEKTNFDFYILAVLMVNLFLIGKLFGQKLLYCWKILNFRIFFGKKWFMNQFCLVFLCFLRSFGVKFIFSRSIGVMWKIIFSFLGPSIMWLILHYFSKKLDEGREDVYGRPIVPIIPGRSFSAANWSGFMSVRDIKGTDFYWIKYRL